MAFLNKVLLIGNLTRDPELRYTPSGTPVTSFGLATTRVYTPPGGERTEETCFVEIVVWGRRAEVCHEFLSKGRTVFIEGRLRLDTWQTDQGEKRSRLRVVAQDVQFLGAPGRPQGAAQAEEPERPAKAEAGPEDDIPF